MGWTEEQYRDVLQKRRPVAQGAPDSTIGKPAKASKHRNRKTLVGGLSFDSAKEAKRWQELSLLEQVGAIRDLRRQVSYDLYASNGERIAKYVADFVFYSVEHGKQVIEDVKSPWTRRLPVYRLKLKLLRAQGITIEEV